MLAVPAHAKQPRRRAGIARTVEAQPLAPRQQLAGEAHVRVRNASTLLDVLERRVVAPPSPPHHVRNDDCAAAAHALRAVNEHPSTRRPRALDEVEARVQHAGNVLAGRVLQPERLVRELSLEVLLADERRRVNDVRDSVLRERIPVPCDGVASNVHALLLADERALFLEQRELLAPELQLARPAVCSVAQAR